MNNTTQDQKPKLLRLPEVMEITTLSRSTIYLAMNNGEFPKPLSLINRTVAWLESEVYDWINDRINKPRGGCGDGGYGGR